MTQLIAGNWKMHAQRAEAVALVQALRAAEAELASDLLVCPPFTALPA
ncbi:MAG: triose-phosphate isomerase, partial [Acetobacteraceae bacterium]